MTIFLIYFCCQSSKHCFVNSNETAISELFGYNQLGLLKGKKADHSKHAISFEIERDVKPLGTRYIRQQTEFNFSNSDGNQFFQMAIKTTYSVETRGKNYYSYIDRSTIDFPDKKQWRKLLAIAEAKLQEKTKLENKDVMMFLLFVTDKKFCVSLLDKVIAQKDKKLTLSLLGSIGLLSAANDKQKDFLSLFEKKFGFQDAFDLVTACPNNMAVIDLFFTKRSRGIFQSSQSYADQAAVEQLASLYKMSEYAKQKIERLYSKEKLAEIRQLAAFATSDTRVQRILGSSNKANVLASNSQITAKQPSISSSFKADMEDDNMNSINALITISKKRHGNENHFTSVKTTHSSALIDQQSILRRNH